MDIGIWLAFIGSVVLFLSTPGPVTVMVANNSARQGLLAGFLTIAGTNAASLVLIAVSFLLIYGVVAISEIWLTVFTLIGSVYLFYFAMMVIKDSKSVALLPPRTDLPKNSLHKNNFIQGFLVGISNPKDVLFFMAFFPLFFGISDNKTLAMGVLTITWVVLDYAILLLYGAIFARIRHPKFVKLSGQVSGVVLLVVAVIGLVKSLMTIFG